MSLLGRVDEVRARALLSTDERPSAPMGVGGGYVTGLGAVYEPATAKRAHPERMKLFRAAKVAAPVYLSSQMWANTLRLATPSIEAADDSPEAEAYAEHVRSNLGIDTVSPVGVRWSEVFAEMLGAVEYGFSLHEMVCVESGGRWYTVLEHRDQASVSHWLWSARDEWVGAVQQPRDRFTGGITLPAGRLLRLTWCPESRTDASGMGYLRPMEPLAADYQLLSALRAVAAQRWAVPTPIATISAEDEARKGQDARTDAEDLQVMLAAYASGDRAHIVLPSGWTLSSYGGEFRLSDIEASIDSTARRIMEVLLQQYLMLGSANAGGSYSASETQLSAMRGAAQGVLEWLAEQVSALYIPRCIEWAFGDVDPVKLPRLRFDGLSSEVFMSHLAALPGLVASRVVPLTRELQEAVGRALEVPEPAAPASVAETIAPPMPEVE